MPSRVVALLLLPLLLVAAAATASSRSLDLDRVRDTASKVMRCYNIDRLQLGVAMQDNTQYKLRLELQPDGSIREMSEDTMFFIASVTKGMFGLTLPLVEQQLQTRNRSFSLFTTPVKEWFGEDFWFLDHERTKMVTIDDLVSHSTGLARHDLMWALKIWKTKEDIFRQTGRLKASTPYRGSFVYNNIVWTIADLAVQKLTNKTFSTYMREFLWNPLGMRSTYGVTELTESVLNSLAPSSSYRLTQLSEEIPAVHSAIRTAEAAGGVVTNLNDMLKYMVNIIKNNYTSLTQLPSQFRPLNPYVAHGGINTLQHADAFNETVRDLPDAEVESYAKGWIRAWYRDNLEYKHTGSLFGIRCDLDVFLKRGFAVFNHMTFGNSPQPQLQEAIAGLLNMYVSDLMLQNSSFITNDNVCHLFKKSDETPIIERIPIRQLSDGELSTILGSYSSYGFGTVHLTFNRTSKTVLASLVESKMELIPIQVTQENRFEFFIDLLEPIEYRTGLIVNRTQEAIYVPQTVFMSSMYFMVIEQKEGKVLLQSAIMETVNVLEKDLDISTWKRPELCPEPKAAEKAGSGLGLTVVMIAVACFIRA